MPYNFNPLIKEQFDYYEDSYIPVAEEAGYLKLDQTTPQTVTGIPIFKNGPPTVITRNASGFITKKEWSNGYYVEYTRDVNNIITSCTDGTNIWTPTYSSGFITAVILT